MAADVGWLAAVPRGVEFWLFDAPHAAMDNAVTPASSRIINRVLEGPGKVTNIDASPNRGPFSAPGLPAATNV